MIIESDKVNVNATQKEVYEYLANAANIEHLLPTEAKDFKGSDSECSFKVQGGITISLVQEGLEPIQRIQMKSGEKSPFPFKLFVYLEEVEEGITQGYLKFDGEVNSFLQVMVKKPLTNLFNYMAQQLKNEF